MNKKQDPMYYFEDNFYDMNLIIIQEEEDNEDE